MMMTLLKKKMRSTRNQWVDRKRRGLKRFVIPASRSSARVSKQSCGERTDVTATPRKGVRPGELRTNRGPPLSLSLSLSGWLRRSGTPRTLPFRAHSLNLDSSTPRGFCSRIKRKRMWPYDTGKSGEEEEKTRILGIYADLWVAVDLLLCACKDSPSSDLNLNNNIEVVDWYPRRIWSCQNCFQRTFRYLGRQSEGRETVPTMEQSVNHDVNGTAVNFNCYRQDLTQIETFNLGIIQNVRD